MKKGKFTVEYINIIRGNNHKNLNIKNKVYEVVYFLKIFGL